jgi:hypothetical protein
VSTMLFWLSQIVLMYIVSIPRTISVFDESIALL